MAYNQYHKLTTNIAAVRAALRWETGEKLSAEDMEQLHQYSGFGGIKAILFNGSDRDSWLASGATEADLRLLPKLEEFHHLLKSHFAATDYDTIIRSLKNSVLTAFYTPAFVPAILFESLKEHGVAPRALYEPSAGAGVFIRTATEAFPTLKQIQAVEKDMLTGKVLAAIAAHLPVKTTVAIKGFEETGSEGKEQYDLVVSNIPFGNFQVYDPDFPTRQLSGKIHNYFFAKGLDKLADKGILAYITTDAFLNNPSNMEARNYLFAQANFVSLLAMPDNLMKDTGNTEAPSHLLIVQKDTQKSGLSNDEQKLVGTIALTGPFGSYNYNSYLAEHPELLLGNEIRDGKNQYGIASKTVWQQGDLSEISGQLSAKLRADFGERMDSDGFQSIRLNSSGKLSGKQMNLLPMPEMPQVNTQTQLGLFDVGRGEAGNKAYAYLTERDRSIIAKDSAKVLSTITAQQHPGHDLIVLVAAKAIQQNRYLYHLYSNVAEIKPTSNWLNGSQLSPYLEDISNTLKGYAYNYRYEGDSTLQTAFNIIPEDPAIFTELDRFSRNGMLVEWKDKIGKISYLDTDAGQAQFQPMAVSASRADFYRQYIFLRDAYLLFDQNNSSSSGLEHQRVILAERYDRFTDQFGLLNLPANKRLIEEDTAYGLLILASLERRNEERFSKADILQATLDNQSDHFSTDDPVEALARCLNDKGCVMISFIEAATGLSEAEVIKALSQHILINPVSDNWETCDQYLSGNVVYKLEQAQKRVSDDPENPHYRNSLEALQKVQPEAVPFELLDFNLGERWIPLEYYNRFATDLFGIKTNVSYLGSLDTFKVACEGANPKILQEYAVTPKSGRTTYGYTLLEHALENTTPFFTYEVQVGERSVRMPDNDAIQLAHEKIESIRSRFVDWLQELPAEEKQRIEKLYNDTFNCYVLRDYDGGHLHFPGLDKAALKIEDLYSSQKNAAWRIMQNRGGLIDHEVGLGKTLTMIVAANEMKRLGIVHKPMILALKANVDQIRNTYRLAYPKARILAPGENDFTPEKRRRMFHEIKNNNWDCIILTHDQFGKIPQSPEIQKAIFETELDNIERDLDTLQQTGAEISKSVLKGLEIRKTNLAGKLKEVAAQIESKKDTDIDFESLGIDHLFIDESHKFKNLTFTTRHNRVAGLGNMEGSQKALNMLFAVRTLQQKFDSDLCVTFLSGTPISNSLTEMYLIFKYLRPKEMERQCIQNFDGWAAVFAKKTTDFEFSVTNEIIAKERFRHFIKVPELALFYNEITDYKTAQHIHLDKPALKEELVNIKPSAEQQEFIKKLMEFARTGDGTLIGRGRLTPEEDKGRMLIATNYAKKMATDMRLISDHYSDHPDNKINTCARKVAAIYTESNQHKGTQIVFCDIGTPKTGEFNMYDALKDKLVSDFGLPAHEITFIHDWSDKKRPELFRKMNKGQIRVLIGSTEKAGTGLNVQERVIATHHLDIPWKPSELEQRNGRGARQGNWLAKAHYSNQVLNFIYATEQSLDNYKFNLLKNKQTFISQMKNCELNIRSIDEGAIDEKSGMNFSEYIAILSGDTSLLEKSRIEKKIAVVESLKKAHFKEQSRTRQHLEAVIAERLSTIDLLQRLKTDQQIYKEQLGYAADGSKLNPIRLKGYESAEAEVIGKQIIALYHKWQPGTESKIGSLYGFALHIRQHTEMIESEGRLVARNYNTFYAERPESGIKYTYNQGHPNLDNPKLAARHFLNAIDRIDNLVEKYEQKMQELEREIPLLQQIAQKPFEREKELADMKLQLAKLEREIAINIQSRQMKENGLFNSESLQQDAPGKPDGCVIRMTPPDGQQLKGKLSVAIVPQRVRKRSMGL